MDILESYVRKCDGVRPLAVAELSNQGVRRHTQPAPSPQTDGRARRVSILAATWKSNMDLRSMLRPAITATLLTMAGAVVAASGRDQMAKSDSDGNGTLSAAEHATGAKAMFIAMDANGDGSVTVEEMEAASAAADTPADPEAKSAAEKIATVDGNGDGALTAHEHATASAKMFTTMDTDRDGALTIAEIDAGHDAMLRKGG